MNNSAANKRYLIISAVFPPEPIVSANLSKDLANYLIKGNQVTVLRPLPSRPFGFNFDIHIDQEFTYSHITLNSFIFPRSALWGRARESFSFGKQTAKYIANHHRDIAVVYANTWPLLAQYLTVRAAKKYNLPIVLHVQDIYPESLVSKLGFAGHWVSFILRPLDSWILKNSSMVIAISKKMKDYLVKTRKINPLSIEVVKNWQDENPFINLQVENISVDENKQFTLMYLGNIGPVAGCDLLIEAFAALDQKKYKLIIAGSGSMKSSLMQKVKNQQIRNVEFISVPDGAVPETQALADVLLLPIKKGAASSSIPSKLPAYMFSAKPIIASVDNNSDTANAIRESGCGWVVEPEKPIALIELLKKVQNLPKTELISMGNKGREYALKHYSKTNNLTRLVNIIEELIKK
jgi:glycosyltransferase involved in cell wall biosynthesis